MAATGAFCALVVFLLYTRVSCVPGTGIFSLKRVSQPFLIGDAVDFESIKSVDINCENEIKSALNSAKIYLLSSESDIQSNGWKKVQKSKLFSLYKRRKVLEPHGHAPSSPFADEAPQATKSKGADVTSLSTEYMMIGEFVDVSPRTLLFSQVNKPCRKKWDLNLKEMSEANIRLKDPSVPIYSNYGSAGEQGDISLFESGGSIASDVIYSRTKWPWPLNDRDCILSRRCEVFPDEGAIVMTSRSAQREEAYPLKKGVTRCDNYRCDSVYMSTGSFKIDNKDPGLDTSTGDLQTTAESKSGENRSVRDLVRPGVKFVTILCDDQKVSLPPSIVAMLSTQGEKAVPAAIERLHVAALEVERTSCNKE